MKIKMRFFRIITGIGITFLVSSCSVSTFGKFQADYVNLLITDIRLEKAYRLDLVFQDDILQKAEIKKEGWGFGANMDPQLLQLLAR